MPAHPGFIVKRSYWRGLALSLSGNAIDLFMRVLGLSSDQATRQIADA